MEKEILIFLLKKHTDGTLTDAEKYELNSFFRKKNSKEAVVFALGELLSEQTTYRDYDDERFMPLLNGILKAETFTEDQESTYADGSSARAPGRKNTRWVLLTVLLLLIAGGVYLFFIRPIQAKTTTIKDNDPVREVLPGGNRAQLTLADDFIISLDSAADGFLAEQGNAKLVKEPNGQLTYKSSGASSSAILYNTLTTPRGGQYRLQLPDGSLAILNSSSSITYPTSFGGKERNVRITGEVFFDIINDANKPFKVQVFDIETQVIGTEFNINAYMDESAIKITVIKGSVKLSKNAESKTLQPGEQVQVPKAGAINLLNKVDTTEVLAWKKGLFEFKNTNLKSALRQVARWYDVDIIYEKEVLPNEGLFGEMRRDLGLSEMIKILEKNRINCRVEGDTLIVLP